ncbi:M56 family metallopeptidase [Paenibacillus sp. NPDC058071]|uniref:M56 family metallopeptidase n=1 Tax=Paenibacillus sp. NPDC058071 TaxID=3346326 RepID=UPI0036DA9620
MDILYIAFRWFLQSTLAASAVALLVMAILKLFGSSIRPRLRHALWLIMLARLLLPVVPASPVSIFQLLQMDNPLFVSMFLQNSGASQQAIEPMPSPVFQPDDRSSSMDLGWQPVNLKEQPTSAVPAVKEEGLLLKIAALVWLVGVIALLSAMIVRMYGIGMSFRKYKQITDPKLLLIMEKCRRKLGLPRPVPLYTGGEDSASPFLFGLVRPKIYIPERMSRELGAERLAHIIFHELAHVRRLDALWNMLGGVALAVHWMNPLVWLSLRRMKADRELACDACVLEMLGEKESTPYGMTMIEVLKSGSASRSKPYVLPFFDSNTYHQLKERIRMINGFKKGSYRLSLLAVAGVLTLSAATLTNAADPVKRSETAPYADQMSFSDDRQLFDNGKSRTYDNMDKAVLVAGFSFKVPYELPEGYKLHEVWLKQRSLDEDRWREVQIDFNQGKGNKSTGRFTLSAVDDGEGLEAVYVRIEQEEQQRAKEFERTAIVTKESWNPNGWKGLKISVTSGKAKKQYYLWQDEGVRYQVGPSDLSESSILRMATSMGRPNLPMGEAYVSDTLLVAPIYDTDDVRRSAASVGIAPKFPLHLQGQYQASSAMVTKMVNFRYPTDSEDYQRKVLSITYRRSVESQEGIQSFSFRQIQNNGIYEEIRSSGQIAFQRIDGQPFQVKVKAVQLAGLEVYKTEPYKVDEALSSSSEPDFYSYFWKENEVCYLVQFKQGEGREMDEIVTSLIREKPVDISRLKK